MKNVKPDDHKLESRLPVEISTTSDTILMAESKEELTSLLKRVKEESIEAGFKFNIQKAKIMTSSPTISYKQILFPGLQKSLWMVTAAMKLKDTCSLEEKL